jgi:hypothetical protein
MKKASEYLQHAAECRVLASGMGTGEHRDQLLEMAATWDRLAAERSELVLRHPELATDSEGDDDDAWRSDASIAAARGEELERP